MTNLTHVSQFKELDGNLSPLKKPVKRYLVDDRLNLSNSKKNEIECISLRRYYTSSQLRRIRQLGKTKHDEKKMNSLINKAKKHRINKNELLNFESVFQEVDLK